MEAYSAGTLLVAVVYSFLAHFVCYKLIISMKEMFIRKGMFGKDLNKTSEDKM